MSVHAPATIDELQEIIAKAFLEKKPVYPQGGMTQQHWLAPATLPGLHLDMKSISLVVDYPHRDMTITVQAGMTVHQLNQILKEQKQCLPIDVPDEMSATVGGSIAANIAGPRAAAWGSWRDYLIGLCWINDQGKVVKAGGRVVKNVAGYDFCKLFVGSLGSLGIVTEVTLKIKPQPEKLVVTVLDCQLNDCPPLMQNLAALGIRPAMAWWSGGNKPQFTIGFEDNEQAVNWQVQQVTQAVENARMTLQRYEQDSAESIIRNSVNSNDESESVRFAIKYPREHLFKLVNQISGLSSSLQVQPLTGQIHGSLEQSATEDAAAQHMERIRTLASEQGGIVTVPRCPEAWRKRLYPFDKPRAEWKLMRNIKSALDPHDLFQRNRHEIFLGE